jgi:hypothetical protein
VLGLLGSPAEFAARVLGGILGANNHGATTTEPCFVKAFPVRAIGAPLYFSAQGRAAQPVPKHVLTSSNRRAPAAEIDLHRRFIIRGTKF